MNHKQRLFAQQVLDQVDHPQVIDHKDDIEWSDPRQRIRPFLSHLFETTGEPLPEEWPNIPPSEYFKCLSQVRQAIHRLYEYAERHEETNQTASGTLRIVGESALALLSIDWQREESALRATPEIQELLAVRPYPELNLDQLYCTPDSSERRSEEVMRSLPDEGRVLCLGDDDLCSLVLSANSSYEVHAFDFDQRLLGHIQNVEPSISTRKVDLIQSGIPKAYHESFDAVILDPPWDHSGLWNFLDKAIFCLAPDRHARIFLSFCPLFLEHLQNRMGTFWQRLASRGLIAEKVQPYFHLYSLKNTQFSDLLQGQLPSIESPLLDCLKELPYGFSHLYTLRRNLNVEKSALYKHWFRWWHGA